MSWQVASFGLIGLVLAGGAVWYERSRPPARLVGLVAALAALAVAGRVALAPLPNVVATTDIALLTGFSLGAAPGFAVGALAGLVSNVWLGQGPWTPWQMAGWGLVGIGGAMLARVTLHRAGRATLAVAAGFAGLAYGALLDLSVMVTYGGEQSLDRYLALSARGIPFNVAHALGNVAIIWAAGPAIVRMLERFRVRSSFVWHPATPRASRSVGSVGVSGTFVLAAALLALVPAAVAGPASSATTWLRAEQNSDGGWGNAPGAPSSPAMTAWAMLGLEAAGIDPGDSVSYLRDREGHVRSATDLERTILALEGMGVDSSAFADRDLPRELKKERLGDGSWRGGVNPTAFGMLALIAAGETGRGGRSSSWLIKAQNDDGGWGFNRGVPSDPDSTGAALQALAAAGGGGAAIRNGVRYLRRAQRGDGGYPAQPGLISNSQSTAWAIQGLVAAGADPSRVRKREASPIDFLRRRQAGDGHVAYSRHSDQTPVWVTAQAVMGLEGVPLPLEPVARKPRRASKKPAPSAEPSGAGGPTGAGGANVPAHRKAGRKPKSPIKGKTPKRNSDAKRDIAPKDKARKRRIVTSAGEQGGETTIAVGQPGEDDDDGNGLPPIAWAGIIAAALAAAAAGLRLYRRHG